MLTVVWITTIGLILKQVASQDDPCETKNIINDWKRSVAYQVDPDEMICDNFIGGWYRITSGAGDQMPTKCPLHGSRCNTVKPVYLSNEGVPPGEDIYPEVGKIVNRTTYTATFDGNCTGQSYEIQIKNCDGYYVYNLQPTMGCYSAYCFGDKLKCPEGTSSDTGFTPGCEKYPQITVTPYVKTLLLETESERNSGGDVPLILVRSQATFECRADDLQDDFEYTTKWYINDIEIKPATLRKLNKDDIEAGLGRMLEEHWSNAHKPNMLVKCSIQVGSNGSDAIGPRQYSDDFFAGVKVAKEVIGGFVVKEGEELEIPIELTMPLSCSWIKTAPQSTIDTRKEKVCLLVLLNGVPQYQTNGEQCKNGISDDGLIFNSEQCGIKFSHANWQDKQIVKITGQADQMVNIKDRVVVLRLYNSDEVTPIDELLYWKNIHLPDIKVVVKDKDMITLGRGCYSNNDPHMRTFDGKYYELQLYHGLPEGEYIMYKHDRLPLQVSAYYKRCYPKILCNCGLAVRSSNSLFVANYCTTQYKGRRKVNRYMKQRICDEKSLIVQKASTTYTITLPTGTKVTFNYGSKLIGGINIKPSILDAGVTKGLCGIYNGKTNDDFTPRSATAPTASVKTFASSWQIPTTGEHADETLFDPDFKLKEIKPLGQEYCTCSSPVDTFPHTSPKYDCELTSAMETCRQTTTTKGVYTASCTARRVRSAGSAKLEEQDDEEPPSYQIIADDISETGEAGWQNGWTEESAKQYCIDNMQNSQAYNICSEFVYSVDATPFITGCVADIKATGGDSWMMVTLKNYASACREDAKRMESLTVVNSTNTTGVDKSVMSIIEESTCPENCSNNGICSDEGECLCFTGFYGELCSMTLSEVPQLERDAFDNLCDKRRKHCHTFLIPGSDFIDGSKLTCKFTSFTVATATGQEIEGNTFTTTGIYGSSLMIYCKLPGKRKKRSVDIDITLTKYSISVSNNGEQFTDSLTTLVYDSLCYECNDTSLNCAEKETCEKIDHKESKKEDKTTLWIGIAVSIVVVLVLLVIAVICICRHVRNRPILRRGKAIDLEKIVPKDDK